MALITTPSMAKIATIVLPITTLIHGVENSEQSCGGRGFDSPFRDGDNDFLLGWPEGSCWGLANLAVADVG